MKYSLFIMSVLLLISCGNQKNEKTTVNKTAVKKGIPTVDVTKTYPKKEIVLQDIADVEYIPLETKDDVLIDKSRRIIYVSTDTIIIQNSRKGDFMFFNGKGKFLSKFNRKGQSGREYISCYRGAIFDKQQKELFVYDRYGKRQIRFQVYDTKGTYKRTLLTGLRDTGLFVDYDDNNVLMYEPFWNFSKKEKQKNLTPLMLMSKATGKLDTLKQFKLNDRVNHILFKYLNEYYVVSQCFDGRHIVPIAKDLFLLNDYYSDTIFSLSKNLKLKPVCKKTPSIKKQEQEKITLTSIVEANKKWLFLDLQIKDCDFKKEECPKPTHLLVNRTTNSINEYQLVNRDIANKSVEITPSTVLLDADDLIELLEEGKLKGKLKTIAENLKEDDNPVLIKVTLKSISN